MAAPILSKVRITHYISLISALTYCPLLFSNVIDELENILICPNEFIYNAPPSGVSLSMNLISP